MVAVEADHVAEREVADDVRVEHEERLVIRGQDVPGERQRAGRAQGLRLQRERDLNTQLEGVRVSDHVVWLRGEAARGGGGEWGVKKMEDASYGTADRCRWADIIVKNV